MKEFDLKEYLANPERKVVTRDGAVVEISKTDGREPFPVVGYIGDGQMPVCWHSDGLFLRDGRILHPHDLFFADKESEDERMMGVISLALTDVPEERFTSLGTTLKDCLAYLEKQKEHTLSIEETELNSIAFLEQLGYTCIPEGRKKPIEWSEEDEKIRRNLMSLLVCMRGDRIKEETYQKYYPWLKSFPNRFALKPKIGLSEEQLEVELDNHTIMEEIRKCGCNPNEFDVARHFYELGLNAKKADR